MALLVASLSLSLLAAEAVLRWLPAESLGFAYREGAFSRPSEFQAQPEHNRFGSHDIGYGPKREGVRRVLLLGDSFVLGLSVPIAQTLARRLAHHLEAKASRPYDVVALAGSGYSPRQELRLLIRHGAVLKPDLVVTVFFTGNDVAPGLREAAFRPGVPVLPVFHERADEFRREDARYLWIERSVLNQLISQRLTVAHRKRQTRGIPKVFFVYAKDGGAAWDEAWSRTLQVLLGTRRVAQQLGAGYALVAAGPAFAIVGEAGLEQLLDSYPDMRSREWDLGLPDRRLARFTRNHDVPFLALQPLFREETLEGGAALHWKYDGHWNSMGNDRAAAHIADFILTIDRH